MLKDDIECNPGPMTKAQEEEQLSRVLELPQKLETIQDKILIQMRAISNKQSRTKANLLLLEKRVHALSLLPRMLP